MKSNLFGFLLSLILFSCLVTFLDGQDSNKKKFRTVMWGTESEPLYYTQSEIPAPDQGNSVAPAGADYAETVLSPTQAIRSSFYDYDPSMPVKIVRHQGTKILLVASVDLSTTPSVLPLLLIASSSGPIYQVRVIDDGPSKFPGGSFTFVNFSKHGVTPFFTNDSGVTSVPLAPNEIKLVSPSYATGKVTRLSVSVSDLKGTVYSANWMLKNDLRYLMFFSDDPADPKSVKFNGSPEYIENLPNLTSAQ